MDLTRRDFLRAAGTSTVAGILFAGCAIPERELIKQSPRDLPEDIVAGLEDWYATSSTVGGENIGVIVRVIDGRARKIEGNPDHPANRGKMFPAHLAGVQALYHPDRIAGPLRGGNRISWPEALDELVRLLRETAPTRTALITRHQRGHLGVVTQTFAQAHGIQHLALEPLENSVLRAAVRQVFGQERLPFFDIANAATVLSIGTDFLQASPSPVAYNVAYGSFRNAATGSGRGTLIHAESRFSMTAAAADTWLPVAPGQEGVLALSIAQVLVAEGLVDATLAGQMTGGQGAAALAAYAPEAVAEQVSVTPGVITAEKIREAAHTLADHQPALVLAGGSAAAQTNGLFNVSAALLLNGLLGNVGAPGGVIFNPDPPLAELQEITPPATYADLRALQARLDAGEIDLVLIHEANPAYELASTGFRESLTKARNVVSFSFIPDETTQLAGLVLPDQVYLESWGTDVPDPAPGYAVLTVQQPVVPLLADQNGGLVYDARAFGDVLLQVGKALGYTTQLPWPDMQALIRERLEALRAASPSRGSVQGATFEAFWVGVLQRGGWWDQGSVSGVRWTPAAFPTQTPPDFIGPTGSDSFFLVPFLSVGLRDGATTYLPWMQSLPDPVTTVAWQTWVEVNSRVARERGFRVGDLVRVESPAGFIEVPVYIHPGIPPNVVSIVSGRGHSASGRYAEGYGAQVERLVGDIAVQGAGGLAWAAMRVTLSGTGQRVRLPRMEGGAGGQVLEETLVIELAGHSEGGGTV